MSNLLKKAWNQAKTVEPSVGNRFPEGKDIKCQLISLKMKPKQDNPENIDVSLSYRTLEDKDKGIKAGAVHTQVYQCYDRTFGQYEFKGQEDVNRLMVALKSAGFQMDDDTEIEEVQEMIREEEILLSVYSKANKKGYINVYVNKAIENKVAEEVVEEDETTDSAAFDDDLDEEDFDEELELEVGMIVTAKPPRHRAVKEYKIITIDEENETANLREMKSGNMVDDCPVDRILKAVADA